MSKIVYGLPYKGSKRRHAETILRLLPCADSFIDGCAGGGAVGQCAVHSGKYKSVTMNEIIPGQYRLLRYAFLGEGEINGKAVAFADRAEFKRAEHEYHNNPDCSLTDAVITVCCSFGNNCQAYLWGEENYQVKNLACKMLYADTPEERRQWWLKLIPKIKPLIDQPRPEFLQSLERLQSLESLESLQSLERLERLERLEITNASLFDLDYSKYGVVFFDPPYEGTDQYGEFDYGRFWDLARSIEQPCYITYPDCPEGFKSVYEFNIASTLSATSNKSAMGEKLICNEAGLEAYEEHNYALAKEAK